MGHELCPEIICSSQMNMVVCRFNMGDLKLHHSLRTGISESENGGSGHVWVLSACLEVCKLQLLGIHSGET
jgi:hypothetical protein